MPDPVQVVFKVAGVGASVPITSEQTPASPLKAVNPLQDRGFTRPGRRNFGSSYAIHATRMKLAARDRGQLVVIAYESGLVQPGWHSQTPPKPA